MSIITAEEARKLRDESKMEGDKKRRASTEEEINRCIETNCKVFIGAPVCLQVDIRDYDYFEKLYTERGYKVEKWNPFGFKTMDRIGINISF